jgi:hypothetical protein
MLRLSVAGVADPRGGSSSPLLDINLASPAERPIHLRETFPGYNLKLLLQGDVPEPSLDIER